MAYRMLEEKVHVIIFDSYLISADVKMKTIATSDSKKFANENIALGMKHLERFITWI
jgi:spore coat polysaccharide biosynthesis predicted glycosyltransferase SpsG